MYNIHIFIKKTILFVVASHLFTNCVDFNLIEKKLVDQNIFDIFIQCGNVINPANQTNDLLNIAIQADTIAAISSQKLQGKLVIDATNLIVSSGFIDLHSHTPTPLGQSYQLYTTGHFRSQKSDRQFY